MIEVALNVVIIVLLAFILPVRAMWDSVKLLLDRATRPRFSYVHHTERRKGIAPQAQAQIMQPKVWS